MKLIFNDKFFWVDRSQEWGGLMHGGNWIDVQKLDGL